MSYRYQPHYCEENAFALMSEGPVESQDPWLVFISNASRGVMMFQQSAGVDPAAAVIWDYHVVVLTRESQQVWDLDSLAGFPLPVAEYCDATFGGEYFLPEQWRPHFRSLSRDDAIRCFSSDRSHMLDDQGNYLEPPPPWDPPVNGPSNLMDIVSLDIVDPSQPHLQPWMDRRAFIDWAYSSLEPPRQ